MLSKSQFTVIETGTKLLMTPPEFAKFTGIPVPEIKEKCKQGVYPHQIKYSKNCKPFIRILVPETLAIIKKECTRNAPFMPREEPKKSKPTSLAAKVMANVLGGR